MKGDGIKSGGGWISSVQLQDLILRHPGVAEVVARSHASLELFPCRQK